MMDKTVYFLRNESVRKNLVNYINSLPIDDLLPLMITVQEYVRSLEQNSKFHAICGDASKQGAYEGRKLKTWQWKNLFVSGHFYVEGKSPELVKGMEGELVNLRESTAQMGVKRMSSLIEYSTAWCAYNNIQLREVRYGSYGY